MPSSHAQNVAFAWAAHAGLATGGLVGVAHSANGGGQGLARPALPPWWPALESAALAALALLIGWARVHLGYHSWDQVAAGWGGCRRQRRRVRRRPVQWWPRRRRLPRGGTSTCP